MSTCRGGTPRLGTLGGPALLCGATVVLMGATACARSGEVGGGASVTVRDSAGITIVENGDPAAAPDLLASTEPTLALGVLDGASEYQFYKVTAVARLSDGTLVVADAGSREVRFYGPDGRHRATVGGAGRGPSDFRYPASLVIGAGDTVVVQDILDRVRFAPDGTFVDRKTTSREKLQGLWDGTRLAEGGEWLPEGTFFVQAYSRETTPPKAGPPFRPEMLLARVGPDLVRVDTLGVYGGMRQQYVQMGPGDRGVSPVVPPFTTNTSWAWGAPDGALAVGDNVHPQLELFGGDGSHRIVRWMAAAEPITTEEVEVWKRNRRASLTNKSRLPAIERAWAQMELPAAKAYYGRLAMGRDGTVWVPGSGDDADPATFLVFAPDGTVEGRVSVPGPFTVHDAGPGWFLGVYRDENGVEFVRQYALAG